jgi:hypothetical protein
MIEDAINRPHELAKAARNAAAAKVAVWNPEAMVLFKGKILGKQESAPYADGRAWTTLLVRTKEGGVAMVELGPTKYVDAQAVRLTMGKEIWVSGSKSWMNGDSIILADRLNVDGFKPSFRKADGSPFWR